MPASLLVEPCQVVVRNTDDLWVGMIDVHGAGLHKCHATPFDSTRVIMKSNPASQFWGGPAQSRTQEETEFIAQV